MCKKHQFRQHPFRIIPIIQEAMESFPFHDKITIYIKRNEILQKCRKLYIISLESLEDSLYILDNFSKGRHE